MKWWLFGLIGLVIVGGVAAWAAPKLAGRLAPIRVGLLHSRTGPMEISEQSMIDAEVLALEEINAQGGLLGGRQSSGSSPMASPTGRRSPAKPSG